MADAVLLNDTLKALAKIEAVKRYTGQYELVQIDHVSGRTTDEVAKGLNSKAATVERWHLECDGHRIDTYEITFSPARDGGTDFSIKALD